MCLYFILRVTVSSSVKYIGYGLRIENKDRKDPHRR